jgi:tetratricopeptide (TPR) repeat protein
MRCSLAALFALGICAAQPAYELRGTTTPSVTGTVSVYAVASPYRSSKLIDGGRFHFSGLEAGAYTVALFVPGRGEARRTIEIGPGAASPAGRVDLTIDLSDLEFIEGDVVRRQHSISAKQLSVPEKARREYAGAQNDLARRDIESAIKRLERAVELAPQFSAAWNNLGTIAYLTRQYPHAEECFRKAIEADPDAFEPLVNLGGVLLTLHKIDEAWNYNLFAVLQRPNDALANAQMGMTYFEMGDSRLAEKYLRAAQRADPAHFSHPQLFLAEIHLRNGDRAAAANDMEDFLKHHPDWPQAAKMREKIVELRQ